VSKKVAGKADIEAGAFFSLFGAATALLSLQYKMGTAAEMGPGFFPLLLGVLLTVIGVGILLKGISGHGENSRGVSLRALFFIALSLALFAILMVTAGMLFAVPALVFVSLLASDHFTFVRAAAISAGLVVFCYVVFVHLLGVSAPMIAGY
jgi:Tripartite tricarboxylate transporter TctB family